MRTLMAKLEREQQLRIVSRMGFALEDAGQVYERLEYLRGVATDPDTEASVEEFLHELDNIRTDLEALTDDIQFVEERIREGK